MHPTFTSAEFTIVRSGLAFDAGTLRYAWFRLRDERGDERIRAVALKELAYLPIETRDDPDAVGGPAGTLQRRRGLPLHGVGPLRAATHRRGPVLRRGGGGEQ